MKKSILSLLFLLLGFAAMAKPVDHATAELVARNFWNAHHDKNVAALNAPMAQQESPFDGLYIFTAAEGGFVIVAADDRVQPILAYSFSSPATKELHPEVSYWLGVYQSQIDYMRETQNTASDAVVAQWTEYLTASVPEEPTPLTMVPVLLATTWDQSPYYNKFCPYDSSANRRTVAGCVATAMAQVMKYWNHPAQGTGSHSYTQSPYGTLSADFGSTTYDWANMPTALGSRSTTVQDNAVATLMYHVGVAVEMEYGASASGAQLTSYGHAYGTYPSSQEALPMYFGYDPGVQAKYRNSSMTDSAWKNYIVTELDAARPVLYAGFDSDGGHCFVCDGYNTAETHFHFNWGWSGGYDGFYSLSALSPGGGGTGGNSTYTFNSNQQILIGVKPAGTTPVTPSQSDTISYCGNSSYYSAVGTSGGSFYWGIKLTPEQLVGRHYLESVLFYVHEAGNYTLRIYAGGNSSPLTLKHSQSVRFVASDTTHWREIPLDATYVIDTTKNLWITFYATGLQYPASACAYTYETNSDWASTGGNSWSHLQDLSSSLVYSWLIKAVTSEHAPLVPPSVDIEVPSRMTVGVPYTFTAIATDGATVTWNLPGASPATATGTSVAVTYAAPGNYVVTATATNASGSNSVSRNVAVLGSEANAIIDTLDYCGNRNYSSSVGTSGGPMHWGIMLPMAQLVGHNYLRSVKLYVNESGSYTLNVHVGGSTAPATLVHTHTCQFGAGEEGWQEFVLPADFAIDSSQNLWITFATDGLQHPAAVCSYSGDPNSNWASIQGVEWSHLNEISSSFVYSWLIKAVTFTPTGGTQGIDEVEDSALTIAVYPNPASDVLHVAVTEQGELNIVDALGRTVFSQTVMQSGSQTITLDVSTLADGLYFVKLGARHSSFIIHH